MQAVAMTPALICLLAIFQATIAWTDFEKPLMMAKPDSKSGIYYFEWVVEETMTMATYDETPGKGIQLLDHVLDKTEKVSWHVRIPDYEKHCGFREPWHPQKHNNLSSLLQLDGRHQVVYSINGKSPADPIVVPLGAEVMLTVRNNLMSSSFSMHVHGQTMRGNWFNDGIPFLQQCPIQARTSYTYRIIADTAGTHWIHGHLGVDRGQGLLSAFIVIDIRKDPLKTNYAMVVQDWFTNDWKKVWLWKKWNIMKWQNELENIQPNTQCHQPTYTHDNGDLFANMAMKSILVNTKGWHKQEDILKQPEKLPLTQYLITKGNLKLYKNFKPKKVYERARIIALLVFSAHFTCFLKLLFCTLKILLTIIYFLLVFLFVLHRLDTYLRTIALLNQANQKIKSVLMRQFSF